MLESLHSQDESQNAFKQLLEDAAANAPSEHLDRVEQQLHNKTSQFRLIGDVVDLFLPNVFRTLSNMVGDNKKEDSNKLPSRRRRALPDVPRATPDEEPFNGRG